VDFYRDWELGKRNIAGICFDPDRARHFLRGDEAQGPAHVASVSHSATAIIA